MKRLINYIDRFYWGSGIANDLPALTYYLLVSLVPFSLGLVVISSLVFGDLLSPEALTDTVGGLLPQDARSLITDAVSNAQANSPLLLAIALFSMMWTSSGAIGVVERVLARMTRSRRYPAAFGKTRNILLGGLLALLVVGAAAAGAVGSGALETAGAGNWVKTIITFAQIGGSIVVCTLLYHFVTADRVPWKDAFRGGIVSGLLIQVTPFIVALYVRSTQPTVGQVFLALALLVVVCSLLAFALLVGAGVAARSGKRRIREEWLSENIRKSTDNGPESSRVWLEGVESMVQQSIEHYGLLSLEPVFDDGAVAFDSVLPTEQPVRLLISPEYIPAWPQSPQLPEIIHSNGYQVLYARPGTGTLPDWDAIGQSLQLMQQYPLPHTSYVPELWNAIKRNALIINVAEAATAMAQPIVWTPGSNTQWHGDIHLHPRPAAAPAGWVSAWTWWKLGGGDEAWEILASYDENMQYWKRLITKIGNDINKTIEWPEDASRIIKECLKHPQRPRLHIVTTPHAENSTPTIGENNTPSPMKTSTLSDE